MTSHVVYLNLIVYHKFDCLIAINHVRGGINWELFISGLPQLKQFVLIPNELHILLCDYLIDI